MRTNTENAHALLKGHYPIAQSFRNLLLEHNPDQLDAWIQSAFAADVPEMRSFAEGISKDKAAVRSAAALLWSSGQVEGQVKSGPFGAIASNLSSGPCMAVASSISYERGFFTSLPYLISSSNDRESRKSGQRD